ncbi:putative mitochondrial hypothetical protein [Leptomonas pyrrhocoris]|uniref:Uncharacterized protein n=1 Tax=Leptomonas pyrrhocoris TaxID=157538 RepID=A0A0M9G0D7_LEPPY|nr:putative mitochondrial hypothetical protein [Leptomonas pyrrhocoris]KPA79607.1 putative mitochondrial hypothetical protein [Leptomonas pyrrhocoris]|eukprot:XP_015658046.1 putative mitochondrial hypothetical protein [Leptomonas pyrrhocoris]
MRVTRLFSAAGFAGAAWTATPLRRQFYNIGNPNESVLELRRKLDAQMREKLPRFKTIETESRLIVQLARSHQPDEREEALALGEEMWGELNDDSSPIPFSSRTAMKISLCSSLRRSALMSKNKVVAEIWTVRFAERAAMVAPRDFVDSPPADGRVRGWREARAQARPGTGIDADDLEADAQEDATADTKKDDATKKKVKEPTVFDRFRQQKMVEHPTVELAFRRKPGPGPRFTG